MKVVYYTSGTTGSGRLVRGISLYNAFVRKNIKCDFIILSNSDLSHITEILNVKHIKLPIENENLLLSEDCRNSDLYNILTELNPDVMLIDLVWYTTYRFINDFEFKKIFLCRQISDRFFAIPLYGEQISFESKQFDIVFAVEPFKSVIDMQTLNPIVIRNRDEILSKQEALKRLKLNEDKQNCLIAYNGEPGEFKEIEKQYSYLKDMNYNITYSTNYSEKSIFPAVDYFNAFDFIVTGAGYNSFWEMIYFNKEGICVPMPRNFEDQSWRIDNCQEYYFEENGADQLVDIILNL